MVRVYERLAVSGVLLALGPACELPHARGSTASGPAPPAAAAPATAAVRPAAPATSVAIAAAPQPAHAGTSSALRFAGSNVDEDVLLDQLAHGVPASFKPVGSTSTVFRMRQTDATDAAFKATTRSRPHGPASEVAAYRLARCLGLDTVPPAVSRALHASTIHAGLDPRFADKWPEILDRMGVAEDGIVMGAAIYWIPDLTDIGVDKHNGPKLAQEWLAHDGTLPDAKRALAASLSNVLAFDYLVGNFDRWSGDNAMGNKDASLIYARDHDQAFPLGMGERLHRRVLSDLLLAERFSRAFYAKLRTLTRADYERELALDPEGQAGRLLTASQLRDLFDRRETLLSHVDSLIALHGEQAVLYFE